MTENDNLKKYGASFQTKIIAGLLSDKTFLERINDIVDVNYFESNAQQWIVGEIISYYIEYKTIPTLDVFKVKVLAIENDVLKAAIVEQLRSVYTKISDSDLTYVNEQFLEFCKNQKLKQAIIESVDLLKLGEYDIIKHKIDEAVKAGAERNIGHDYHNDIEARMKNVIRSCVKTDWAHIDKLMDGGLGAGELGIIVGAAGGGKCIGPNTELEIQYHETGIEITGNSGNTHILWFSPFDKFEFDDKVLFGWQIDNILFEIEQLKVLAQENH
jgi:hypothetical protein